MRLKCLSLFVFIAFSLIFIVAVSSQDQARVPGKTIGSNQNTVKKQSVTGASSKKQSSSKKQLNTQTNTSNTPLNIQDQKQIRQNTEKKQNHSYIDFFNILNEYSPLLSALFSFLAAASAAFIALYLGLWKPKSDMPKLIPIFNNKGYPFVQLIPFNSYPVKFDYYGQKIPIFRPGLNVRVKIFNNGKTMAKQVQARVEKIEFYGEGNKLLDTKDYHPTTVKWSGEKDWGTVDIAPKSPFYLDALWIINETTSEIVSINYDKLSKEGIIYYKQALIDLIDEIIKPSQKIYWNVWVDNSYHRGLRDKYNEQGKIHIYYIISAQNSNPIRFKVLINWSHQTWHCPDVKMEKL